MDHKWEVTQMYHGVKFRYPDEINVINPAKS